MDILTASGWFFVFYLLSYALVFVLFFMFGNMWVQVGLVSAPLAALLLDRKRSSGNKFR